MVDAVESASSSTAVVWMLARSLWIRRHVFMMVRGRRSRQTKRLLRKLLTQCIGHYFHCRNG